MAFWIEWTAATTGLICVWGYTQSQRYGFFWGAISAALYVWVFAGAGLYGDTLLNLYFLGMNIAGAFFWSSAETGSVQRLTARPRLWLAVGILIAGMLLSKVIALIPGFRFEGWSGLVAALGLAGQWLLNRRYIENWSLWLLANAISIGLCMASGLYPTAGLYLLYLGLAIRGHSQWQKIAARD